MANNYTHASFSFCTAQPLILSYLVDLAEAYLVNGLVDDMNEPEPPEELGLSPQDQQRAKSTIHQGMEEYIDWGCLDGTFNQSGDEISIYHEENINVEAWSRLLQLYLDYCNLDEVIEIQFCWLCSRPRTNEFGGGGVVVTKNGCYWQNGGTFVQQTTEGLDKGPTRDLLLDFEARLGWNEQTQLGLLFDYFDQEPAAKADLLSFLNRRARAEEDG